jgi:hypothetical protein
VFKVNEPQQPSLEIANAIEQSRYRKYFTWIANGNILFKPQTWF